MKNTKSILKLVVLAMLIALGVVISPILRVEGMCPMAHLINIVCSVLLGPWYSLLCATLIGIIRIGFPASIQNTLFSISSMMIQSSINSFDTPFAELGIAPYTSGSAAASAIDSFLYTSLNSFYHASMNFTGQNYAAGKYNRVRRVLSTCMLAALGTGVVLGAAVLLFGKPLLAIYVPGDELAIAYGYQRLLVLCPTYFFCGIMEVLVGQLRGLGKSLVPMFISVVGICGFRAFWIYTVFAANHTLPALYVSYPISWALTFGAHMLCYLFIARKKLGALEAKIGQNA